MGPRPPPGLPRGRWRTGPALPLAPIQDLRDGSAGGVALEPLHSFHPTAPAFMFPWDPLSVGSPPFPFAGPASVPGPQESPIAPESAQSRGASVASPAGCEGGQICRRSQCWVGCGRIEDGRVVGTIKACEPWPRQQQWRSPADPARILLGQVARRSSGSQAGSMEPRGSALRPEQMRWVGPSWGLSAKAGGHAARRRPAPSVRRSREGRAAAGACAPGTDSHPVRVNEVAYADREGEAAGLRELAGVP
jgi:hypothetical protein